MKKTINLFSVIMLISLSIYFQNLNAQEIAVQEWVARYNGPDSLQDVGISIDVFDNVYVAGTSKNNSFFQINKADYVTIKYDRDGNEIWTRRYDGPGNEKDKVVDMLVDKYSNVYVTGRSWKFGNYDDWATIKYDTYGNIQWTSHFNGPMSGDDEPFAMTIDDQGNIYITGYCTYYGSEYVENKVFSYTTVKYNSDGVQQWVAYTLPPDSMGTNIAKAIVTDTLGNVYVTGTSNGEYSTVKYNSNGIQLWEQRYSVGVYTNIFNIQVLGAQDLILDENNNVYVTGLTSKSELLYYCTTIKYNTYGVEQWKNEFKGIGAALGHAITTDNEHNILVTGANLTYFDPATGNLDFDYLTIKYSSDGVQQWTSMYGGNAAGYDMAWAIATDAHNNVYITGGITDTICDYYEPSFEDPSHCATVKYDKHGNQIWTKKYRGLLAGPGGGRDIALDEQNNVYVTGASIGIETDLDLITIKYHQYPAGTFCINAISLSPDTICQSDDYEITGTQLWFKFIADTTSSIISVILPQNTPVADIRDLYLYQGSCDSLQQIAHKGLDNGDSLTITASNLTTGNTYYIKVEQQQEVNGYLGVCVKDVKLPPKTGLSCEEAIEVNITETCITQTYRIQSKKMWFTFPAGATDVQIEISYPADLPCAQIKAIKLCSGNCDSLNVLAVKNGLTYTADGLIPGNIYYLELKRSIQDTGYFNLCIYKELTPKTGLSCEQAIDIPVTNACEPQTYMLLRPNKKKWFGFVPDYSSVQIEVSPPYGELYPALIDKIFLYDGNCDSLILIYQTSELNFIADNLIPGNKYYVKVRSTKKTLLEQPPGQIGIKPEFIDTTYFDLCIHYLLTADAGEDKIIILGESTEIGGNPTAIGSFPPYSYSWTPITGLDNANISNPIASPVQNTTYIVTVTDSNNNTNTDTVDVIVQRHIDIGKIDTLMQDTMGLIFDRFGNIYTYEDIKRTQSGQKQINTCQAGIFELTFVGDDFDTHPDAQPMEHAICQVFTDLSVLINHSQCNGTDPTVYIQVNAIVVDTPGLASATPFYHICCPNDITGIIESDVWKAINGGVNNPDEFDGVINVPFDISVYNGATWNYVLEGTPSSTPPQYDIYSVMLHEAIHTLGFASLIGANGQSLLQGAPEHYSRFDTYLHSNNDADNFISWDGCYDAHFNLSTDVITSGCENVVFDGNNTIFPQPVFAPTDGYMPGSSLSHFFTNCGGIPTNNYVMHPAIGVGQHHKVITPEEVRTLCDLGYETTGNFGDGSLDFHITDGGLPSCGEIVAGVNDGYEFTCTNEQYIVESCPDSTITISPLENDINAETYDCLEIKCGNGNILNSDGISFEFDPVDNSLSIVTLTYIPVGQAPNHIRGNITCIQILVTFCGEETCATLEDCNQLCNPDFSDLTVPFDDLDGIDFEVGYVVSWTLSHGTPRIDGTPANPCAEMWSLGQDAEGNLGSWGEGIITGINVQPNMDYIFSYRRKCSAYFFAPLDNIHVYLIQSDNSPGIPNLSDETTPGVPATNVEILQETDVPDNNQWQQVVVCFHTPNDGEVYDWLWIYPEQNPGSGQSILHVDDVELIEDNFDLGDDISIPCGYTNIGNVFCAVANTSYEWTVINGDMGSIDDVNIAESQISVNPELITTYQLTRTFPDNPLTVTFPDPVICNLTDDITVEVTNPVVANITITNPTCGIGNLGTATANPSGGTPPYLYEWNINGTIYITQTVTELEPGTYTVTVTDANGCTDTESVEIYELGGWPVHFDSNYGLLYNSGNNNVPQYGIDLSSDNDGNIYIVGQNFTDPDGWDWDECNHCSECTFWTDTNWTSNAKVYIPQPFIFMGKYDRCGTQIWEKEPLEFDEGPHLPWIQGITVDNSGNAIIAGAYFSLRTFIAKYNSSGDELWKTFIDARSYVNDIITDNYDTIYITGTCQNPVYFNSADDPQNIQISYGGGGTDAFIAKYSPDGKILWVNNLESFGFDLTNNDKGNGLAYFEANSTDKRIYAAVIIGNTEEISYYDVYVANHKYIFPYDNVDFPGAFQVVCVNADNGLPASSISINISKSNSYEYVVGKKIKATSSGVFVTGYKINGPGERDVYLEKFKLDLSTSIFKFSQGATGNNVSTDIAVSSNGKNYITGYFTGPSFGFDGNQIYSDSEEDVFIACFDNNLHNLWLNRAHGNNRDIANSVTLDNNGSGFITGFFYDDITFEGPDMANLITEPNAFSDIYIARFSTYSGDYRIDAIPNDSTFGFENNNICIYPNPAENYINIKINLSDTSDIIINIYDIMGRKLLNINKQNIIKEFINYDISGFTKGLYFITIIANNKQYVKKIFKN